MGSRAATSVMHAALGISLTAAIASAIATLSLSASRAGTAIRERAVAVASLPPVIANRAVAVADRAICALIIPRATSPGIRASAILAVVANTIIVLIDEIRPLRANALSRALCLLGCGGKSQSGNTRQKRDDCENSD